ncbi:GlxA family transcriptional regulator [Flavihumibacter petaseus]|nr:helix-turn-helix domain-containing protein [Flavihumibacter petaseus]
MKQVAIVVTQHYKLLSIAAIMEVFEAVNRLYQERGEEPPFLLRLVGQIACNPTTAEFHGYKVDPISESGKSDLVMVPSFNSHDIRQSLALNSQLLPWLREQYKDGAELACFCTGAFLMAATGLLDGRLATTHVDAGASFSQHFPQVKLRLDKTVTADHRLYTSGGATSTFHLLLHLINRHCGREVAVKIAKIFAIDMDRHHQSYFGSFEPVHNHTDELVATAQQKIETNYQEAGTIEELIRDIPSSRRNIVRRFKQVTGVTPIEYLQNIRVEAAKRLLEQTSQQMSEVVFNAGYNDAKAFRKVFRKAVGMTPSEYRLKFQVR